MTIIALGVMPYISASIIMQLLMALVPSLQRDIKESPDQGRRKMGKWTRLFTVGLAFFQAGLFAKYAVQLNSGTPGIIVPELIGLSTLWRPLALLSDCHVHYDSRHYASHVDWRADLRKRDWQRHQPHYHHRHPLFSS